MMSARAPLRTLIADDEPLARSGLREMLGHYPDVDVIGEAGDGLEAARLIAELTPDLLFLDVQMPESTGFDVLKRMDGPDAPLVVFVTAYEEFAFPAFEANALDYLLKPFNHSRLRRTLDRVSWFISGRSATASPSTGHANGWRAAANRIVVNDRGSVVFVEPEQVEWVESWGNYVRLFVDGRPLLVRQSMNAFSATLDPTRFVRISRQVVVNAQHVQRLALRDNGQTEVVLRSSLILIASRRYRDRLRGFFSIGRD